MVAQQIHLFQSEFYNLNGHNAFDLHRLLRLNPVVDKDSGSDLSARYFKLFTFTNDSAPNVITVVFERVLNYSAHTVPKN